MSETANTIRITRVGTVIRMGEGVPPMFTFRDPDGNRFRMVERE